MASIIYSPKDIFEQEFKTSMRGYDKKEVDEFLDDIIKDYESYISQVQELRAENEKIKQQLASNQNQRQHHLMLVHIRLMQSNKHALLNQQQILIF